MTFGLLLRPIYRLIGVVCLITGVMTGSKQAAADPPLLQPPNPRQNVILMCNPFPPSKIADRPVMPGSDVEILRAAFAVSHIAVITPFYPWKRAYLMAEQGAADGLCSCSYSPERETAFLYSNELGREHIGLFSLNNAALDGIEQLADAKQLTIGVVAGYTLESQARNAGLDVISANSENALLGLLLARRLDAIFSFQAPMQYTIRTRNQTHDQQVKLSYRDIDNSPYYSCISRKAKSSGFLLERLNHGLTVLRKNGVYGDILEKYGMLAEEHEILAPLNNR